MTEGESSAPIEGPAGKLEALLSAPAVPRASPATAIVLHPHPQHGGSMHNKVAHTLARAFDDLGLATIRFNFRGVGKSAGAYGHGEGELADALAVAAWVRAQRPGDAIWFAGFSFGGAVALRAAASSGAAQLVTVAPALRLFEPKHYSPLSCPWLVIQGEADDVVPAAELRAFLAGFPGMPTTVFVPEAGHFFHQRLNDLRRAVTGVLGR